MPGRVKSLAIPLRCVSPASGRPAQDTAYGSAPGAANRARARRFRIASATRTRCTVETCRCSCTGRSKPGCCCRSSSTAPCCRRKASSQPAICNKCGSSTTRAAGCDLKSGTPFAAQQLYFSTPIARRKAHLSRRRTDRLRDASANWSCSRTTTSPYRPPISNSPYFVNPYSITISGDATAQSAAAESRHRLRL